jgi:hypothetical protein
MARVVMGVGRDYIGYDVAIMTCATTWTGDGMDEVIEGLAGVGVASAVTRDDRDPECTGKLETRNEESR